nr:DNA adenine methylase [Fusobacterium gastrosuis]
MKNLSPLRYPGGKVKFYNNLIKIFQENKIVKSTYIEPFAGGSGLALKLLKNNIVEKVILNDIDKGIFSFWKSVLFYNEDLCSLINLAKLNLSEREIQKSIYFQKDNLDLTIKENILKLGFATFYLNRVNRSGIIKAGVIGGINQNGNYKMDCRFNKEKLISKIKEIYDYRNKIKFYNLDVIEFLNEIPSKNSFIFFDPPYYKKGQELYTNYYTHNDHLKLSEKISSLKTKWIITYDNADEIKEIYSKYNIQEFDITYSLEKKRKAKEIIIYNNLIINLN